MRRGFLVLLATASLGLALSACDWPQFRLGPTHSGDNQSENTIGVSNVGTVVEKWRAPTGGLIDSSPSVANGVVYVGGWTGSFDHNLYAFDAAGNTDCSGTPKLCAPLWKGPTLGGVGSSPAVVNGMAYASAFGAGLNVFDAAGNTNCTGTPKTCAPLWTAPSGGSINLDSPVVSGSVVYTGGGQYAFDANGVTNCSGSPKVCNPLWTTSLIASAITPAVANGVLYTVARESTSNSWNVTAFDANGVTNCSGTPTVCSPLWTAQIGGTSSRHLQWSTGWSMWAQWTRSSMPSTLTASPTARGLPRSVPLCGRLTRWEACSPLLRSPTALCTSVLKTTTSTPSTRPGPPSVRELQRRALHCGLRPPQAPSTHHRRWLMASSMWALMMTGSMPSMPMAPPTALELQRPALLCCPFLQEPRLYRHQRSRTA